MINSLDWDRAVIAKKQLISIRAAGDRIDLFFSSSTASIQILWLSFEDAPFFGVIVVGPVGQHFYPAEVHTHILNQRPPPVHRIGGGQVLLTQVTQGPLQVQRNSGQLRADDRTQRQVVLGYELLGGR